MLTRPSWPVTSALALLLAPVSVFAFSGSFDHALQGPTRTVVSRADVNARLSAGHAGWRAFLASEGPGWSVVWDEAAGSAHRIWGQGLSVGDVSSPERAVASARRFLAKHEALVGVPVSELQLRNVAEQSGLLLMTFTRTYQGVPVHDGQVDLVFKKGRLVSMGLDTYPELSIDTTPRLDAGDALEISLASLPEPAARVTPVEPGTLFVLPTETDGGLSYHLAWRTTVDAEGALPHRWVSWVDAQTGELLSIHDDIKWASGTVQVEYETRTVGDPLSTHPASNTRVTAGTTTTTNAAGEYDVAGSATTVKVNFKGEFITVTNFKVKQASASLPTGEATWAFEQGSTAAEQDTFVAATVVRQRALSTTPTLPELQRPMTAIVNKLNACNAFYNGNINFLSESATCNNTGRIQDVVFHEYGHHYHYSLVESGTVDGSIGEGSGDFLSATITGSPLIGPGFFKAGPNEGAIREIETDKVYPRDVTGAVHQDGLIWAGAMWDLRKALILARGEEEGIATVDKLFAGALSQGPKLSNCYQAVLVADDDDGNLVNGTPNKTLIDFAFGAHGLTP